MSTVIAMPALRYEAGALAPVISQETINFHYGKHLQAYVQNLNKMIAGTEFADATLEDMAARGQGGIGNNAGQVLNHMLYFEQFASQPAQTAPTGALAEAVARQYGTLDALKTQLSAAAATLFGSGWAWLCADAEGQLSILQLSNADNPLRHGLRPLLTIDVWEHAYYLDYQNRRADYIAALWNLIDWAVVDARYF